MATFSAAEHREPLIVCLATRFGVAAVEITIGE
jgi:hypothetical protein